MKKLILLLSLVGICLASKAQCELPYKPLSEFNKDTTAFIIYNFMDRADCYKGKTVKEIEKDLQIPIKDYVNIMKDGFVGLGLCMYNLNEIGDIKNNDGDYNYTIYINWEDCITDTDTPRFRAYQENNVRVSDKKPRWKFIDYDFIKDLKIKNVYVDIPGDSKYYEKYKEQKRKSRIKNSLQFTF
ncbi:MAG: hypothetical protein LBQ74_14495 [Prevotella sp.]|jgi:hypothetical protein|nr:hypothetical protein [Prevotella sp.]